MSDDFLLHPSIFHERILRGKEEGGEEFKESVSLPEEDGKDVTVGEELRVSFKVGSFNGRLISEMAGT